jgi:hypothetical protein
VVSSSYKRFSPVLFCSVLSVVHYTCWAFLMLLRLTATACACACAVIIKQHLWHGGGRTPAAVLVLATRAALQKPVKSPQPHTALLTCCTCGPEHRSFWTQPAARNAAVMLLSALKAWKLLLNHYFTPCIGPRKQAVAHFKL